MITFEQLTSLKFQNFEERDWDCYSGCVSKSPKIAEDENYVYIIEPDSNELIVISDQEEIRISLMPTLSL